MSGEDRPCAVCGGHVECASLSYRKDPSGACVVVDDRRVVPAAEFLSVIACNGMCCVIEDLGMDVREAEASTGMTALHCACDHDEARAVALLLKLGARTNVLDKMGRSPLAIAASRGCGAVVAMLLEARADANL
jgi:hypothetical protein